MGVPHFVDNLGRPKNIHGVDEIDKNNGDLGEVRARNSHFCLGKFHHDRSLFSHPGIIVRLREIIPKWAELFRLVKYYNLPR